LGGAEGRSQFPGFDGIRLIAAVSVIFSHAFLIAEGTDENEPLRHVLGPGNTVGLYGVFTFFIISGFLLTRSLAANPDLIRFTVSRVLRIYPGFVFCTVLTALLFGSVLTGSDLLTYLTARETYTYINDAVSCLCDAWGAPFSFSHSTLPTVINGSLWTLSFEVLSYVLLMWLWIILRRPALVAAGIAIFALASFIPFAQSVMRGFAYTLPYFAGGVLMYAVFALFGTKRWIALICVASLCLSSLAGIQHYTFAIFGAYLVVFLGERPNPGSAFASRFGDWSYGIYLFGWPTEQIVQQLANTGSGLKLFLYSLPVTLGFAALSWFVIERPCLQLKQYRPRSLSLVSADKFS
jgi:peptidoglycan/LPS O-acetylase OafA/YrhL